MAGMLPGVECARRRRLHLSGDSPAAATHGWTRRPSFCLYTSNHESHHAAASSLQRIVLTEAHEDGKLGAKAREAKERLDERLRIQKKSEARRHHISVSPRVADSRSVGRGEFQTELFCSKKSGSRRFSWTKLSWKASEQDECSICLEHFNAGDHLLHLPCAHRYHAKCLVPWLESSAHCPCCRMEIHA
uniref:RING finger protein 165-like isoform X2 n=1 Tax=Rhizophora mucronata TaxID=61149 RepID=A0A2P2KQF1_RHIMU